jgi:hypothetical protein
VALMPVLDPPEWTPSVAQVALHLLARTRQSNGVLAKTFNSDTEPTDVDVAGIIAQVCELVGPRLGPVPDALMDSASALAALKCAITVERSYFIEQVSSGASPVAELAIDYALALKDWDKAATGDEPNGVHVASMPIGSLYPGYATGTW